MGQFTAKLRIETDGETRMSVAEKQGSKLLSMRTLTIHEATQLWVELGKQIWFLTEKRRRAPAPDPSAPPTGKAAAVAD